MHACKNTREQANARSIQARDKNENAFGNTPLVAELALNQWIPTCIGLEPSVLKMNVQQSRENPLFEQTFRHGNCTATEFLSYRSFIAVHYRESKRLLGLIVSSHPKKA
jgi:hypothetical protein